MKKSIKTKILVSTSLCVLILSLASNTVLYKLLNAVISEKSEDLNTQYTEFVSYQLEHYFYEISNLGFTCSSDNSFKHIMTYSDMSDDNIKFYSYKTQDKLNTYLSGNIVADYVNRLFIFNEKNMIINAHTKYSGYIDEIEQLQSSHIIKNLRNRQENYIFDLTTSLNDTDEDVFVFACPIISDHMNQILGYVYIEISTELFQIILEYPGECNNIFITDALGKILYSNMDGLPHAEDMILTLSDHDILKHYKKTYRVYVIPLSQCELSLYNIVDISFSQPENLHILYVFIMILLTTTCVGIIIAFILSKSITKPIQNLKSHIKNITETNDFTCAPKIEQSGDEIGEIGHSINYLTKHITELLQEKDEIYEQKKDIEIALLQSQVNPHFLYNTLDSIRWMAIIQKNDNIANTIFSLENLLKNVAKGVGNKITLESEFSLLDDYIHIQSIRYIEAFHYEYNLPQELLQCKIIKFTLQPLIENAIYHGIVSTGRFGTIRVNAASYDDDIVITIEDDGAGIDNDTLSAILETDKNEHNNSLSGMGVTNVDTRLKLVYGSDYGLSYESKLNEFTRVTVRIPKETEEKQI